MTWSTTTTSSNLAIPSGHSSQRLLLDPDIRDWVVLPLLVMMIAAGLIRHYLGQVLRSKNSSISPIEYRAKSCLLRASRLRGAGSGFLTRSKWEGRIRYLSDKDHGLLREEAEHCEAESANAKNAADPMNAMTMMEGMKGNMAFMAQNMVMMQGISHFFKGFVLLKVPFPLTNGFKMMFQRGLDLTTLDTSYVSSVSWYFLVMFGLRAFFRLVIGDISPEFQESMQLQYSFGMSSTPSAPGQQFNAPNALRAEADNLELVRYKSTIDDVERRLLGDRYPKKKIARGANAGDDIFGFASTPSAKSSTATTLRHRKK